jgi:diacylglycerol kinase family enzyme
MKPHYGAPAWPQKPCAPSIALLAMGGKAQFSTKPLMLSDTSTCEDKARLPGPTPFMRRAALIYNPASGQLSGGRAKVIGDALAILRSAGVYAQSMETNAPGSAGVLAQQAVSQGCDTILACGGDGTANEILQHLVGSPVALGIVPLGTANALAADLHLGSSPLKAVNKLLSATPVQIPVGRISYLDNTGAQQSRYFTVAAGVGADALCISMLDPGLKRRFGYALYMVAMFRVWATHTFPLFDAAFVPADATPPRVEAVSEVLAVRIRDFGGLLHHLAPGASLHNQSLRLLAFKTRSRFHYLRFVLASLLQRQTFSRHIELLDVQSVECRTRSGSSDKVFVEADGELLGGLPVKIEIAPDKLTLLIPQGVRP